MKSSILALALCLSAVAPAYALPSRGKICSAEEHMPKKRSGAPQRRIAGGLMDGGVKRGRRA